MKLLEEIQEQPRVLQQWLESKWEQAAQIADVIRAKQQAGEIDFVLLAARGTSDHAGVYAQYLWGARNGLPVALAAPSLYSLYGHGPRVKHALVVGISQSGQSPDVVGVIEAGRAQGALTLAITNAPDSPLAQRADFSLDIGAGQEKSIAATKTYTAELLALAALSVALEGDADAHNALLQIPDAVARAVALQPAVQEIAREYRALQECIVLGRGYNYASALEWALKLKELCYVLADPYSVADFQHGPVAVVEPGFPVLAIAPRGAALREILPFLEHLRADLNARLLVISDDDDALRLGNASLHLPADVPEWLSPLVSIIPAQLFCYHLALAKGLDAESPRGLRKVTLTR